jgi:hypothetical protein
MSSADVPITSVEQPERAGKSRAGQKAAVVVFVTDERPSAVAIADYLRAESPLLPHFYLARDGALSQLLTINRAGDGLGRAIW